MRKYLWTLMLGLFCTFFSDVALAEGRRGNAGPVAAAVSAPVPAEGQAVGVVNLNEAPPEQLQLLPGVGPSKARAILEHRKAHPFKKVEDLTKIKGIGRKTFTKLRPYLAVSGPTTLSERPKLARR